MAYLWARLMNLGVNAKFDQPTGLYTFHELKKQLPVFINQGMEGAILLFDVDRLQRINDILGYMVGDASSAAAGAEMSDTGWSNFLSWTGREVLLYYH